MSQQIQITGGAKVRNLEGVLTGTSGVVNSLAINVPNGIPQLDGSGKILVNQLPNSVMEYKGSWNAATNTPTLTNGTGNAGDVYLCEVAGTVNFGAGPIAFFVGDQVVYSGSIWQRASGATGTVTSVAVTESGDALTITGSPITTSGTINIGFTGNSGQYVNGAGGLTTFPTDNITGSGASGQVTYFNGTNTITGENSFNYDASNNRLGVNTTVPNATIGANAGTDSGYSLLLKNDNANYNGIGFATTSTYGNVIGTEKLGTAPARNLTLLNQSGYISITEVGNLGVNILNPNTGLDIYNGTSSYLWLHTANSGITGTDGVRLALFSTNTANLRNFEGAMSITSEGDFSVITLGDENFRVNSADGSIYQAKVPNAMLKSVSGVITAAVAGTDYVVPSALSSYVPYTGATTNVNLGTFDLTADVITGATGSFASSGSGNTFAINHSSGSGIALNITKGGNGEGLYINKTSGSGNAATIIGTLNATTIVKDGGTSSQYLMADGSVTTSAGFITGSGVDGRVPYFNGTSSITSEAGFIYDSSTNRLGVNTSVPNATIGADAALNSGYGLLIKTGASDYNGIGIAIDSTYGNTIEAARLGTAPSRNLTLLNVSGYVSLTETGNFGVGILTPNNGIDIYNSTQSQLWLHNAATGITATDGVRLALFNSKEANLRNFDGGLSITAEGDFSIITIGTENFKVNSANGFVAIGGPASITSMLTVNGAITQYSVTSALLKTNASGTLVAAVAGTDYVIPSALSGYVPTSRTITINGTTQNLSADISYSVGTIGGSGTTNYLPKFTGSTTLGNSAITDDGTTVTLISRALSGTSATFSSTIGTAGDITITKSSAASFIANNTSASGKSYRLVSTDSGTFIIQNTGIADLVTVASNGDTTITGVAPILAIQSNTTGNIFLRFRQSADTMASMFYTNATATFTMSNNMGGLRFNTSGTSDAMNISGAGDVFVNTTTGINITSGWTNLTVNGSTTGLLGVQANGTNFGGLYANIGNNNFVLQAYGTSNTANMVFLTNSNERMRITSGGNVIVGASTSDLIGSFKFISVGNSGFQYAASSGTYLRIEPGAADTEVALKADARSGGYPPMTFYTSATERMRITSDGAIKNTVAGGAGRYANNVPEISQAADTHCQVMNQRNASFSASGFGVFGIAVDRAATTAYSFAGWYSNLASSADKEFDFRGDGNGYADGSWNGGGADYAEYFEWADGNINNEDRRGYSVSLVNNKIKIAEQGENIIGVISANPSIVGDAAWNKWSGKYLKDEFNSYILDKDGHRTLNPNYDEKAEYIPREQRPEWSVVGLMGKLRIRKGQATMPNWIKMRDISENVEEWLIK
jgi:hypothetical protein